MQSHSTRKSCYRECATVAPEPNRRYVHSPVHSLYSPSAARIPCRRIPSILTRRSSSRGVFERWARQELKVKTRLLLGGRSIPCNVRRACSRFALLLQRSRYSLWLCCCKWIFGQPSFLLELAGTQAALRRRRTTPTRVKSYALPLVRVKGDNENVVNRSAMRLAHWQRRLRTSVMGLYESAHCTIKETLPCCPEKLRL